MFLLIPSLTVTSQTGTCRGSTEMTGMFENVAKIFSWRHLKVERVARYKNEMHILQTGNFQRGHLKLGRVKGNRYEPHVRKYKI